MVLLLLACTGEDDGDSAACDTPTIELVAPVEGDVVCGTPLVVVTNVACLTLVDPYAEGGDPEEGTGHIDAATNGQAATMSGTEEFEIPDLQDGEWQIKVELSDASHEPILPYAGDLAYITVDSTRCGS